jgi:hypothetical protein
MARILKKFKKGGVRAGSGRPYKWPQAGKTRTIRVPSVYVDKILEIISYMYVNDGQVPGAPFSPLPGYKPLPELPYPHNPTDKF